MKILLNHIKLWFFLMFILGIDFLIDKKRGINSADSIKIICLVLTLVLILSYFIKKISKVGFYVNSLGFTWKTNGKEFHYPWETIKVKTLIDFNPFTVIEISTNKNPKYRLLISWLSERKGLEEIERHCPKNHKLYEHLKKYSK